MPRKTDTHINFRAASQKFSKGIPQKLLSKNERTTIQQFIEHDCTAKAAVPNVTFCKSYAQQVTDVVGVSYQRCRELQSVCLAPSTIVRR